MADEEDDGNWVMDLEKSLQDELSRDEESVKFDSDSEFPDAVRAECWQARLGIQPDSSRILAFPDIFDLPDQEQLRADCQVAVDRLGNDDEDKVSVLSDMESVITCYCKTHSVPYTSGWVDLLLPILALKRPRADTYDIFEALLERLVPRQCDDIYHVLRLLILYHEPQLCSFLDTMRITPDLFARPWFNTLFAGVCDLKVVHTIWDIYLQRNDPFYIFFLSLVIVLNVRELVPSLKNANKNKVIETISQMPSNLEYNDVKDFCSIALYYILKTPKSFRAELEDALFGRGKLETSLSQALCLPVSAHELVESATDVQVDDGVERVRFFLVDCRPADQYNAGHLATAFHLDSNLMLQEPTAFNMAVQGLLTAQRQALAANSNAGGNHLCFMGSGRDEEDQYTHMVVSSFLQKHVVYVSILAGGYEAIHEYFGADMSDCIEDHNSDECLVCRRDSNSRPVSKADPPPAPVTNRLLGKFSAALKTKSADIKDKLIEYIVNPTASSEAPKPKNKLYRGIQPVFSIADEENGTEPVYEEVIDSNEEQTVNLAEYLSAPDIVASWRCRHVMESSYTYASHLVLTQTHLVVLRDTNAGETTLVVKRPLASIIKITAKKRHPDLITFKYGNPDSDAAICDMDRFIIPQASDVTAAVSKQVLNSPLLAQIAQQQQVAAAPT